MVKGSFGQIFRRRFFTSGIVVFSQIAHNFLHGLGLPERQLKPISIHALILAQPFFYRIP
jgi:hypothetical protein